MIKLRLVALARWGVFVQLHKCVWPAPAGCGKSCTRGSCPSRHPLPLPYVQFLCAAGIVSVTTLAGTQALYTLYSDADTITEHITEGFLRQLQNHLAENGDQIAASGLNITETLDEFVSVAKDILSYLRHKHSKVILLLLRQYSERGSIAISDADPDELQQEVRSLLNVTALGDWFAVASQTDHGSITTIPWTQASEVSRQPEGAAVLWLVQAVCVRASRLLLWL